MNAPASSTGRHATIFDVARTAGVSKSTVSNVIRGVEGVAPQTRVRIHAGRNEQGPLAAAYAFASATRVL